VNETLAPDHPAVRERLRAAWKRLRGGALSPGRAAASIAVGLFVGCTPLYGVHSLIVLAICIPLRLDGAVAYLAAHISNPLTFPFVFGLEMEVGSLVLTGHGTDLSFSVARHLGLMKVGARLVCGAAVVGPAAALVGAITTWFLTLRIQDAREPARAEARKRTLARYSRSSLHVRTYVRSKLLIDPALESITALIGSFGRVVDAGCGFGQIGLSLLDRGRAVSLVGIDADPSRIEAARAAAGGSARYEVEDLSEATFSEADTILFIDSLHYLPLAAQNALLARGAAALAPGGRLIVREVAPGPSFRSKLTERIERRAARRRGHEGLLAFRETADLVRVMEEHGLTCSAAEFEKLGMLDNAFIVGEKPRAPDP
jgi:uncharacterized protein (DUF2062 family)/ubiquinone/menaquinone biosynthesis C-methylase UbiE